MTVAMYEKAIDCRLKAPRISPARRECACYLACDIGAYNSCGHLCRYCYANHDAAAVRMNMRRHDPDSPLLIGHILPGDKIREAKQDSWKDFQLSMI